jgi:PEP-CTERM motif-containing protein
MIQSNRGRPQRLAPRLFLACQVVAAGGFLGTLPLNAALITAAGGQEGVTTDQFDISQGTTVIANSAMTPAGDIGGPSTAQAALGGTDTFVEPTHAIFSDSVNLNPDFIEFKTATPIALTSYSLYLENDGPPDGAGNPAGLNRAASSFELLGGTTAGNVTTLIDSGAINGDYVDTYNSSEIRISNSAPLALPGLQYFEIQLVRAESDSGPRLVELDGFGQPTPEPSTLLLGILGMIGLLALRRFVQSAR